MDHLAENLQEIRGRIAAAAREVGRDPGEITLVAATKTQTAETVRRCIALGITCCGENRVQEMTDKLSGNAYDGARLHLIGQLQKNKVKQVVGRVDLIESVDSAALLEALERQAEKCGLVQGILLEVNIGGEAQKGGCPARQAAALAGFARKCPHLSLRGLMCVPPPVAPGGSNRNFFTQTRQLLVDIRQEMGDNNSELTCLSMGMSGDYEDAVRCGATHVRVGTALFGPRQPLL